MKIEITGYDSAVIKLNELINENKWAITVVNPDTDKYVIQYTEHKKFTTKDGADHFDEVWTNVNGDMTFVQDMSEEDARDALRVLLKEERFLREEMLSSYDTSHVSDSQPATETKPVLH
jgi:hypothetical protein